MVILWLYHVLICSEIDNGNFVYGSTEKSRLFFLDPVHNSGVHLSTGIFHTTFWRIYAWKLENHHSQMDPLHFSYGTKLAVQPHHLSYGMVFQSTHVSDMDWTSGPPWPMGAHLWHLLEHLDLCLPHIIPIDSVLFLLDLSYALPVTIDSSHVYPCTLDYLVFGLCPSSSILKEHNSLEMMCCHPQMKGWWGTWVH
jgi:hypothetical protein